MSKNPDPAVFPVLEHTEKLRNSLMRLILKLKNPDSKPDIERICRDMCRAFHYRCSCCWKLLIDENEKDIELVIGNLQQVVPPRKFGERTIHNMILLCMACKFTLNRKESLEESIRARLKFKKVPVHIIEERINKIREWIGQYQPKSPEVIFGPHLSDYLRLMDQIERVERQAGEFISLLERYYGTKLDLREEGLDLALIESIFSDFDW